jgi:hypothetical protein
MVGVQELDPSWFQMVVYFVFHKLLLFVCLHYVPQLVPLALGWGQKWGPTNLRIKILIWLYSLILRKSLFNSEL